MDWRAAVCLNIRFEMNQREFTCLQTLLTSVHVLLQVIEDINRMGEPRGPLLEKDSPPYVPMGLAEQIMKSTGNQFASVLISVLTV